MTWTMMRMLVMVVRVAVLGMVARGEVMWRMVRMEVM